MGDRRRNAQQRIQTVKVDSTNVTRKGLPIFHWGDLYHLLFAIPFPLLLGLFGCAYLLINTLFACAYVLGGNGIENARPGSFLDAFFFSVQTFATIGYGAMNPTTSYTNFLVAIEVFVGMLSMAIATGLLFARFSQPTARVLFSKVAVICPYNGVPTLMLRAANQRSNLIVEAQVNVTILLPEITPEGHSLRRLYDLKLTRSSTPLFFLSWTIMHPIDETSPLYGKTGEMLANAGAQLVVILMGFDETVSQTIHARQVYFAQNILWNQRFVDVVTAQTNGDRAIDYDHFHNVVPFVPDQS